MNPTFIDPAVLAAADPATLESLLTEADWSSFVPERDLPVLRDRLTTLEQDYGVTPAHRLATDGVRARGTTLSHPAVHVSEITAVGLSPSGSHLATAEWGAGRRGIVQIWEVATGRCVNALPWVDGGVGMWGTARAVQWSADGLHLGMAFRTNAVGVWDPFGWSSERHAFEESEPRAEAQVTDGADSPPPWALHPDGRSAYVASGAGGPGVQGCIPPLDSGVLYWRHDEAEPEPEWVLAKGPLPPEIQEAVGEELEIDRSPTWSADGTRLCLTNRSEVAVVDVATGDPLWIARIDWLAAWSPDQRYVAHLDDGLLQFRDATDGRLISEPVPAVGSRFDMSLRSGLRGSAARFAAVRCTRAADPGVEIFDDGQLTYRVAVTPAKTPSVSDFATWAWAPSGDRGAVLTESGDIEIWSLGDGEPQRLRSLAAPTGTQGVLWGAGDVVVATGKETLRFWRADTGKTLGDYEFRREADAELPIHGDFVYDHFDGSIVALDRETWCLPVEPDMAIAPPERRADVEAHLAWIVDRRFAWPLRWGRFDVWPDAQTALAKARTLSPDVGVLRTAVRELTG